MLRTLPTISSSAVWRGRVRTRSSLVIVGLCLRARGLRARRSPPTIRRRAATTRPASSIRLAPPSCDHWLGTTLIGRDVFSQMLWGARPALLVGGLTALGTVVIGVNVGLIAGYFGGRVDAVLMRITDMFLGLPFLPFIIVVLSMTGRSLWTMVAGDDAGDVALDGARGARAGAVAARDAVRRRGPHHRRGRASRSSTARSRRT